MAGVLLGACVLPTGQVHAQSAIAVGTVGLNDLGNAPLIKSGKSGIEQVSATCAQETSSGTITGYYADTVIASLSSFSVMPAGVTLSPFPFSVATSNPALPTTVTLKVATSKTTPSGSYGLAVTGIGTMSNPARPACTSYNGSIAFDVFPSASMKHASLMALTASGTPATGAAPILDVSAPIPGSLFATAAYSGPCVAGSAVFKNCPAAQVTPAVISASKGSFTLQDPTNPAGTTPNPGVLSSMQVIYQFVSPNGTTGYGTTLDVPLATFGMSCYATLLETDWGIVTASPNTCNTLTYNGSTYSGTETNPFGGTLAGTHCRAFDEELGLTGAAQLASGVKVKFTPAASGVISSGTVSEISAFTGAQGLPLVAGLTGARDLSIIPTFVSGTTTYGLQLDRVGLLAMNDTGAAIAGYRIGLYKGVGVAACAGYSNPIYVGGCLPASPGTASTCPVATSTVSIAGVPKASPGLAPRPDILQGLIP